MIARFLLDLRNAGRSLAQSPGFTAVAVAILMLGIGANATIFTLVDGLFLQPPGGVGEPAGLVRVNSFSKGRPARWWSYPDYVFYRDRNQVFSGLAAWSPGNMPVTAAAGDRPRRAEVSLVSANFFDVLRVRPEVGRGFLAEEGAAPGQAAVAVVSHGFFQRALGSRREAVGSALRLNGHPFTVIGVAPRELRSVSPVEEAPDLWVPLTMQPVLTRSEPDWWSRVEDEEITWLQVLGRLRPGVSLESAQANMDVLAAAFGKEFPAWTDEQQGIELLG